MKTIYELTLKDIYESAVNRYFAEKTRLLKDLNEKQQELKTLRTDRDRMLKRLQSKKAAAENAVSDMTKKSAEIMTELSSMSDNIVKTILIAELNKLVDNKEQALLDVEVSVRSLDTSIVETEHKIKIIARSLSILDEQYPIFAFQSEEEARNKYETYIQA